MKHALRSLLKSPGFTAIALLTLALGIGVNTSMFSVLNTVLFHTPPYPGPDTLIRVFRTGPSFQFAPHSPANFIDFQAQVRSFSSLAAFSRNSFSLAEPGQPAEQLGGLNVTAEFFPALGVQPALGRVFTADEDRPGHDQVVVLSDAFWRRRFGADPSLLGRQIRLDGQSITVIGVMPAGFDDPLLWGRIAAWRPMAFSDDTRRNRGGNWLSLVGRLRAGVTSAQAEADMTAIAANLARAYPDTNAQTSVRLVPLVRSMQDETLRMLSWFTMGLAACVLLIACANLANLLFARNALRAREHAIRAALGASRLRLIWQTLTESLLLSLVGGALGLLVAVWCNSTLGAYLRIAGQTGFELPLDWSVLGFALAATLLTGVGFGLLPAVLASRTDVNSNLKQGSRGSSGAHHRLRHALIVTEVALALVLLSSAGFFIRGLDRFAHRDHGWRTESLLTANLTLPYARYHGDPALAAFYDRLQSRLATLPGVERIALSRTVPFFDFGWGQRFVVEGQPVPKPGAEPMRDVNGVSPEYFDTLGLAFVAGRSFTVDDIKGPARTVINESMARQLWPNESALGKRIMHPVEKQWQEVIGVVRDVGFATNLESSGRRFQTYRLLAREPSNYIALALRCSTPPAAVADALRRAIAELDPELPVQGLRSADEIIEDGLSNYTVAGWLLAGFAVLGLLLAAGGIYGVISGFVAQRTAEIGIRMALGAQVRDVLRLVLGQGLRLALVGTAIGLVGAFAAARLLASIMPALPAPEVVTAVCVSLALLAVAALACWLPARRATKVDPMTALRAE